MKLTDDEARCWSCDYGNCKRCIHPNENENIKLKIEKSKGTEIERKKAEELGIKII